MRERGARGQLAPSVAGEARELVRLFEDREDCNNLARIKAKSVETSYSS
jgi:hypothetical protein